MRVRSVSMGRGWVCMSLCWSQIHYSHMVAQNQTQVLGGLVCAKNQRTWVYMRERSVGMGRVGMCMSLCYCQIQYIHMVTQKQTTFRYSTGIWPHKNRHESCGGWTEQKIKGPESTWGRGTWSWDSWRVWVCILLCCCQIQYIHMVVQKQTRVLWGLDCEQNQRTWVHMRERNVVMGRLWVCILLCCNQIQYSHMVAQKQTRDLRGLGYAKNQRNMVAQNQTRDLCGLICTKNQRTWVQVRERSVGTGRVWVRRMYVKVYCGVMWYVHERWSTIFDGHHLRDPAGIPPLPTMSWHNGKNVYQTNLTTPSIDQ